VGEMVTEEDPTPEKMCVKGVKQRGVVALSSPQDARMREWPMTNLMISARSSKQHLRQSRIKGSKAAKLEVQQETRGKIRQRAHPASVSTVARAVDSAQCRARRDHVLSGWTL